MSVDISTVRAIALAFPSVEEGICHGTTAFYVRRKLLARLQENGEVISIAYPKTARDDLIEKHPDAFSVTDHFRNYDYVLMNLAEANKQLLKEMVEQAWRMKAGKRQVADFDNSKKSDRSSH